MTRSKPARRVVPHAAARLIHGVGKPMSLDAPAIQQQPKPLRLAPDAETGMRQARAS